MNNPPSFLTANIELKQVAGTHNPFNSGRQSELIAWLSTAGALLGTFVLSWRNGEVSGLALGASLLFFTLASVISFGNWIDRNTSIRLSNDGIRYRSPIRRTELEWKEIEKLSLLPSNRGWRVRVAGETGYFHFQTQGSLRFGEVGEMKVGIPAGEDIASCIRQRADLELIEHNGQEWVCRHPG